jgi:hypothetical protein
MCAQVVTAEGQSKVREERLAKIREQIREEMVEKMRKDRSTEAVTKAKEEAEAKARCLLPSCPSAACPLARTL